MREEDHISPLLTHQLSIGHGKGRKYCAIADGLDLSLESGKLICLLGPNGSGKSTLIRTLVGFLPALGGEVRLGGASLDTLTVKDVARRVSIVLPEPLGISHLDVWTLVAQGRSPYTGWSGRLSKEDERMVVRALEQVGMEAFVGRMVDELSDGERQKIMLARALAQDTEVLLLDEPTAHLDLPNRVDVMRTLQKAAREERKAVLLSTHELDLSMQVGDEIWLMNKGGDVKTGTPEDLILNGALGSVFQAPGLKIDRNTGAFSMERPETHKRISVGGKDELGVHWTRKALERYGFQVEVNDEAPSVLVRKKADEYEWELVEHDRFFMSLKALLDETSLFSDIEY